MLGDTTKWWYLDPRIGLIRGSFLPGDLELLKEIDYVEEQVRAADLPARRSRDLNIRDYYRFLPKPEYFEPERISSVDASQRRVFRELEKARIEQSAALYPVVRRGAAPTRRATARAAGADRRAGGPGESFSVNPRNLFGSEAETAVTHAARRVFLNAVYALPCIQRVVRREVMFARRKAGRGYRKPRKHGPFTSIWC